MQSNKTEILERLDALAARFPGDTGIAELSESVRSALEARPAVFVSMGKDGVFDVASDDILDIDVFVIDETLEDDQGTEVELDADDGSTYRASVKKLAVTAPHFDVEQVSEAATITYANGMKF